jgi:hypothetical protein
MVALDVADISMRPHEAETLARVLLMAAKVARAKDTAAKNR